MQLTNYLLAEFEISANNKQMQLTNH